MKKKISVVIIALMVTIIGITFCLIENRNLDKWDNPSDENMYTYAVVYTQIETDILEEIKNNIRELYPLDKAGEGMFCYTQKWRNSGFIRINFALTKEVDLASERLILEKDIEAILNKHNEITIRATCIIDDKGDTY